MLNGYLTVSTVIFCFLFFVWKKDDFLNMFLKFVFFLSAIVGSFLVMEAFGYIIKV